MIPLFTDDVPDPIREAVERLWTLDEWPQDWTKDVALVRRLTSDYPTIDVREEAGRWVTWLSEWREKHPRKKIQHRSRFSNWCQNAARFQKQRARRVQHRPPGSKDEHGGTRIEGW